MSLKNILIANIKNITDFLNNAGAFAIYLVIQQFVVLPGLAREDEALYCLAVLFVTIMNIVGSVIGDDAGNCWLVRYEEYRNKKISPLPDILRILFFMCLFSGIVLAAAAYFCKVDWRLACGEIVCIWFCALRFCFAVYFRKKLKYKNLIWCSLVYCAGMLGGFAIFKSNGHWIWIFLCAEIAALLYNFSAAGNLWKKHDLFSGHTVEYNQSWILYSQLSLTSLLLLAALYLDRFILYRLLDLTDVAVYFAASAMSKVIFMLGNPLYSFLLAKFSNSDSERETALIRKSMYISFFVCLICGIGSVFCIWLGMYCFYNAYLTESLELFLPLCLASGFGMAIVILRSLVIKFCKKWLLLLNTALYTVFIFASGWFLTVRYGSIGMCWAVAAGQFIQTFGLVMILISRR